METDGRGELFLAGGGGKEGGSKKKRDRKRRVMETINLFHK